MKQAQIGRGKTATIPGGFAWGAGVSLVLTLGWTAVMAWLVSREKLPWEKVGYGIMGMLFVSAFGGAVAAYHKIRRQRLVVCLMSGVLYFGILLLTSALGFGGQFDGAGVTAGMILAGSGCAALLGLPEKRGSKGFDGALKRNYRRQNFQIGK